ncbi:hypothetical protein B0H10DRAFT_2202517 [Mycena sp. CBHHK59/15]|nr:hypothetical protein B0H10DRAFT_2202517 [Mycena sp. CBHHK59/15]
MRTSTDTIRIINDLLSGDSPITFYVDFRPDWPESGISDSFDVNFWSGNWPSIKLMSVPRVQYAHYKCHCVPLVGRGFAYGGRPMQAYMYAYTMSAGSAYKAVERRHYSLGIHADSADSGLRTLEGLFYLRERPRQSSGRLRDSLRWRMEDRWCNLLLSYLICKEAKMSSPTGLPLGCLQMSRGPAEMRPTDRTRCVLVPQAVLVLGALTGFYAGCRLYDGECRIWLPEVAERALTLALKLKGKILGSG